MVLFGRKKVNKADVKGTVFEDAPSRKRLNANKTKQFLKKTGSLTRKGLVKAGSASKKTYSVIKKVQSRSSGPRKKTGRFVKRFANNLEKYSGNSSTSQKDKRKKVKKKVVVFYE